MSTLIHAAQATTDGELVLAARDGDADALLALLSRHDRSVAVICARYCQAHEIADVKQETFLRAIDRLDALRDPEAFGPWLRSIARNVARDVCRQGVRVVTVPDLHEEEPCARRGPDAEVIAAEEADGLHEHLATLGERDRRALWLRDAIGVSVPEIAEEFGLTEGAARVMLTRARRRLRESFGGVAAALGGWWHDLHERLGQHAGVLHPVWAAAVQVGAVALVLALPYGDQLAPTIVDAPAPAPGTDAVEHLPPEAANDAPLVFERRGAAVGDVGAPTDAPHHPPTTTAGPLSIGAAPPDDAHEPVGTSLEVADEEVTLELFPGNVIGELGGEPGGAGTSSRAQRGLHVSLLGGAVEVSAPIP